MWLDNVNTVKKMIDRYTSIFIACSGGRASISGWPPSFLAQTSNPFKEKKITR
jgi:hypothetical protein